jgi:PAS domain S-box-containing protein
MEMTTPAFLHHPDSVVAAEIKAFDWQSTPLGAFDDWPKSLQGLIAVMLGCPTPMFLAWGPDLLSFYNDAYRPILGYRAETATGKPFPKLWESLWADISPLVDEALAGRNTRVVNMRLDLSREGVPEESYWTFSYSPAFDDDGKPAGMLCITEETTSTILAIRDRESADERLQLALSAGNSIGAWDWDVPNNIVRADARFAVLYGVDPAKAAAGASIDEFFGGIHPDDLPRVQAEIEAALTSDELFRSDYRLLRPDGSIRWVSAQGRCMRDGEGRAVRFPGVSFDITDRVLADAALKAAKEERDFVIDLTARQRAATDPFAIIRLSMEALGKRVGADRAGFYRLLDANRMQHTGGWSDGVLKTLIGEQPTGAYGAFAENERRVGRTLVFSDSRYDYDGRIRSYNEDGVLGGICVPLSDEGRWSGGIYLHQASVRAWAPSEISLVKEIAGLTAQAVERAEANVRLTQRLDQQESALSNANILVAVQSKERLEAETTIRQLQKMEAVGQLTGGIAHDFNNMLAIVIGGLNFAQRKLARGDVEIGRHLDNAMEGATRAAALTQRLLAFSRQQPLAPEAIDTSRLLSDLTELLARTLGEQVALETALGVGVWKINADPNQLENVIINLAVNARDAMPGGGKLTIETSNASIDEEYARDADIKAGQYVLIAVSDTGTGMTADVLAKAFDPFFTTKGVGKGTGLGLSQVFGFVRQSNGYVKVYSEVGHGTTIKVYLPRFWGEAAKPVIKRATTAVHVGKPTEIILVVEDENRMRNFTVEALREFGYSVLHAANGAEGLAILESEQDVTLLFTDIVMPDMTGRKLADRALQLRPSLKVLYTTGYTRNAIVHNGVLDPGTNFIAKPFRLDQLSEKVREVLDSQLQE